MKILVIGCGSIGRRHIRLLRGMGVEVVGYDPDMSVDAKVLELGAEYSDNWDALLDPKLCEFNGAIVATPNHLHLEPATEFLLIHKRPVLVEKPLAHTLAHASALAEISSVKQVPLLVGYCLRFHPGLRRLKQILDEGSIGTVRYANIHFGSYLPNWRPGTDYRTNYAASKEQGGGILLDASHELDYALWLFGEPESVMCQMQNTGALEIETEDVADLVVRFRSGVQANIHLDYLQKQSSRWCKIVGDDETVRWRFTSSYPIIEVPDKRRYPVHPDDLYRYELQHFLQVIHGDESPLVTGEDGLRVLKLVEAAKESARTGRVVWL